eukprot:1045622-Pyramimonas_sp.AAC.1
MVEATETTGVPVFGLDVDVVQHDARGLAASTSDTSEHPRTRSSGLCRGLAVRGCLDDPALDHVAAQCQILG